MTLNSGIKESHEEKKKKEDKLVQAASQLISLLIKIFYDGSYIEEDKQNETF